MLEGQDAIQRDIDGLEERNYVTFMKFNKAKCKGWGNPQSQHRLGNEWMDGQMESSSVEKDFEVLVDDKLDMSQPCAPTTQKSVHVPGCIRSVTSRL